MSQNRGTVLFVAHEASRTGAPILLLRFLTWLRERNETRFQILLGRSGELYSDFKSLGPVDIFEPTTLAYKVLRRFNLHHRYLTNHRDRLRKKLKQKEISLVYANSVASAEAVDFLSFLNVPIVCHVHELDSVIDVLGHQCLEFFKENDAKFIAVSDAVTKNLVENHLIPRERIPLVSGFIPITETVESEIRSLTRQELGVPTDAKLVCGCGSIESNKGLDLFLDVASHVTRNNESAPIHFVWIGGKKEAVTTLRQRIELSPLKNVVQFIGKKVDVARYFGASDVFLLTSRQEALGLVMLEAALQETPIICFDGSGYPPDFVEQDAGYVISDFDTAEMSKRLTALLSSPGLCQSMGKAARKKVIHRHNLSVEAPRVENLIKKAMTYTFQSSNTDRKHASFTN